MKTQLFAILNNFKDHLLKTPLLLGWLVVGPLVALYKDGWLGLTFGLINLLLVGLYALLIRWLTPDPPSLQSVKRPKLEIILTLGLFGAFLIVHLLDFGVWSIQPWQGYVRTFLEQIRLWVQALDFVPQWARQDVYLALSSMIKKLIPTLLLFLLLGYKRKAMGLADPHWKLTAILVGSTAVFGLFTGVLTRAPLPQVLILYGIGIFVNALPEELVFRALLLPRLEKVFANPLNALVISALLFNALHLPIALSQGSSLPQVLLDIISIGYPSGLIWGYLYLRTRSIVPGMFWHAANGNLGFLMMSL